MHWYWSVNQIIADIDENVGTFRASFPGEAIAIAEAVLKQAGTYSSTAKMYAYRNDAEKLAAISKIKDTVPEKQCKQGDVLGWRAVDKVNTLYSVIRLMEDAKTVALSDPLSAPVNVEVLASDIPSVRSGTRVLLSMRSCEIKPVEESWYEPRLPEYQRELLGRAVHEVCCRKSPDEDLGTWEEQEELIKDMYRQVADTVITFYKEFFFE